MGQSNPGGTHYQDLLREYERNLYNAQARDNRSEIDHWERTIDVVLCQDLVQVKMRNFFPF